MLGCPPHCPDPERNRYLIHLARYHGVPVYRTPAETVEAALAIVTFSDPATHLPPAYQKAVKPFQDLRKLLLVAVENPECATELIKVVEIALNELRAENPT
ncbi:hypothetical protein [Planobispora longispora]|uniref:Uncharacterized protein n=1 Tax=Planobispora longispora TaxID=28887 RepID=A0A8J3RTN4_9ACTN|nr:hypothetical protein [Planobispora longispora]BFE88347.1 hypothetical protein GCM10020093_109480 [Planobispora longispora]GIH79662.1 hypothetical protein Plo01_60910 [Planobispora longispora]